MNKLIALILLMMITSFSAISDETQFESESESKGIYLGIDAQSRFMGFQQGFSSNANNGCRCSYGIGYPYFGVMINRNFSFELGIEPSISYVNPGEYHRAGIARGPELYRDVIKMNHSHISVSGFLPMDYENFIELFGSIGVSHMRINSYRENISFNGTLIPNTGKFKRNKPALRISAGVQCMLMNNFGLRFTMGYINTSRVSFMIDDHLYGSKVSVFTPKDTAFFGIGLIGKF